MMAEEPEKQVKLLRGWLAGFQSVRTAGQRYRVVYRVENAEQRVLVHMVGIRREGSRRDIYALVEHLVQPELLCNFRFRNSEQTSEYLYNPQASRVASKE